MLRVGLGWRRGDRSFVKKRNNFSAFWQLIHIEADRGRGTARLTLDTLILAYLLGEPSLDRQLQGYIYPVLVDPSFTLPPVYETNVREVGAKVCFLLFRLKFSLSRPKPVKLTLIIDR
ncbi:hypothetical protein [Spirulina sp. 06S082]|uniref:hypothetical protein n=1 Tax=Spirulina sp. 06S082 TaxID=3110248 RepID=UPI002B20FCE7|nr:hypothetical protein [Spirulina sp. 06S082]MEA5468256.1 hypothetical protein [Spirulina sp. 06S082]